MKISKPVLFFVGQYDRRTAERKWLNATANARLEVPYPRSSGGGEDMRFSSPVGTSPQVIPEAGYMCVIDKRYRDKVQDLVLQFATYALSLSTYMGSLQFPWSWTNHLRYTSVCAQPTIRRRPTSKAAMQDQERAPKRKGSKRRRSRTSKRKGSKRSSQPAQRPSQTPTGRSRSPRGTPPTETQRPLNTALELPCAF